MALLFLGSSVCALCGKLLLDGENITGLPAITDREHLLYKYFDSGFHTQCFDNWEKKEEVLKIIKEEKQQFKNSDYFKEMTAKYGPQGQSGERG